MLFFKSKYEKELDQIILRIEMNCSNNYKDAAQENLREFEDKLREYKENGKIKEGAWIEYEQTLASYKARMKGYTHKDQKPYWT